METQIERLTADNAALREALDGWKSETEMLRREIINVRGFAKVAENLHSVASGRQLEIVRSLQADNAALLAMVKARQDALCRVRAMNWNLGGPANRDELGNWVVWPAWESKMLAIIADAIGPLNGDAPIDDHPGAKLLESHRGEIEKLTADNAALVEALELADGMLFDSTGDFSRDWSVIKPIVDAARTQPHPGAKLLEELAALREEVQDLQEKLKLCFAALRFADLEHDEERCAKSNHFLWCRDCLSYAAQG